MKAGLTEIEINGQRYVLKDSQSGAMAADCEGLAYSIIRADRAGVFAGYVAHEEGDTVIMKNCRRVWYWNGAASLSEMAVCGVSKPADCKFPCAVPKIKIHGVIEIIQTTEKARLSIEAVAVWSKR